MTQGFIKLLRTDESLELLNRYPNAYLILSLAANRASWKDNAVTGMKIGQAMIGYADLKYLSRDKYRTALQRIVSTGFATIKSTNRIGG